MRFTFLEKNIFLPQVTREEQKLVPHHLINILDPLSHNNVVDFRNKALPIVEKLLSEGRIPVICGGTNYYIESLLWKILVDDDLPFIVSGKRLIDEDNNAKKIVKSDDAILWHYLKGCHVPNLQGRNT